MRRCIFRTLALIDVVVAAPAAATSAAADVRIALASLPPDNGAPFGSRTRSSWYTMRAMFNALTELGPDMALVPALASGWRNQDPLTWTFTLREGITFSNG